ncbi:chalcone isomerase family protein [Thermodesulfobacteriota bacterium]
MVKRLFVIAVAVLVMASMASAGEIGGVDLPDSLTAGKDTLLLNGAGLRKKFIIKVYAGGLYLFKKNDDPKKIIAAYEPMAIRMHFIYDGVSSEKLVETWNEGFENATGGNISPIKAEIDMFNAMFTEEAKKNDIYDIIYIPGQGVSVYMKDALKGTIKGLDFKKALFSIWLGDKPADKKLKKGMLGK